MNITDVVRDPSEPVFGDAVVNAISMYINPAFSRAFFDSCEDVTFGETNTSAMLFVGGGATNFQEFLDFMGKKQFLGSPFEITYVEPDEFGPPYEPWNGAAANCFDQGPNLCQCIDCPAVCPATPVPTVVPTTPVPTTPVPGPLGWETRMRDSTAHHSRRRFEPIVSGLPIWPVTEACSVVNYSWRGQYYTDNGTLVEEDLQFDDSAATFEQNTTAFPYQDCDVNWVAWTGEFHHPNDTALQLSYIRCSQSGPGCVRCEPTSETWFTCKFAEDCRTLTLEPVDGSGPAVVFFPSSESRDRRDTATIMMA